LGDLGLTKAVAQVTSVAELRGITLNVAGAEISLAIRNRSLDDCYRAVCERVAAGGKGWEPR